MLKNMMNILAENSKPTTTLYVLLTYSCLDHCMHLLGKSLTHYNERECSQSSMDDFTSSVKMKALLWKMLDPSKKDISEKEAGPSMKKGL